MLAKIKWEAKLVRRGRVNTGDAAGGMDSFGNKSLPLVIFLFSFVSVGSTRIGAGSPARKIAVLMLLDHHGCRNTI